MSAAATTLMSRSPAIRPAVAALGLPRTRGMPRRKSSTGKAQATTPTKEASQLAKASPTGPTQLGAGYEASAKSRNEASVQATNAATSRLLPNAPAPFPNTVAMHRFVGAFGGGAKTGRAIAYVILHSHATM